MANSDRKDRKAYRKPRLRHVSLAADEVLAKGCKIGALSAPLAGHPPCWFNNCFLSGS